MTVPIAIGIAFVVLIFVGFVLIPNRWPCGVAGKECRACAVCGEGGPSDLCMVCYGSGCAMHPRAAR